MIEMHHPCISHRHEPFISRPLAIPFPSVIAPPAPKHEPKINCIPAPPIASDLIAANFNPTSQTKAMTVAFPQPFALVCGLISVP
jgi:hypothetical protein